MQPIKNPITLLAEEQGEILKTDFDCAICLDGSGFFVVDRDILSGELADPHFKFIKDPLKLYDHRKPVKKPITLLTEEQGEILKTDVSCTICLDGSDYVNIE